MGFPIPSVLTPLFFFLIIFWPILIILVFDFLYGLISNVKGNAKIIQWIIIHVLLHIPALAWKYELNQQPSLSFENIVYQLTYTCTSIYPSKLCVMNIDITFLLLNIILFFLPGLLCFRLGIYFRRYFFPSNLQSL